MGLYLLPYFSCTQDPILEWVHAQPHAPLFTWPKLSWEPTAKSGALGAVIVPRVGGRHTIFGATKSTLPEMQAVVQV